jgi:hypothetical protein
VLASLNLLYHWKKTKGKVLPFIDDLFNPVDALKTAEPDAREKRRLKMTDE